MSETNEKCAGGRMVIDHKDLYSERKELVASVFDDVSGDGTAAGSARRLAAAWNATREIPVEALEVGVVAEMVRCLRWFEKFAPRDTDHACAECDGTIPVEGFRCAYHSARALLSRLPTSEVQR